MALVYWFKADRTADEQQVYFTQIYGQYFVFYVIAEHMRDLLVVNRKIIR